MPETLVNLRTRAQGRADMESDANVPNATWNAFINASRKRLRRIMVSAFPHYFMKSASFTLSGTSYTYALSTNVTDFWKVMAMERSSGNTSDSYDPVPRFVWAERFAAFDRCFRVYAGTLEIRPASMGAGTYVLWYISQPAALVGDSDVIDLAEDMYDEFLVLEAAIKARKRQRKDVAELQQELNDLIVEIRASASDNDVGEPDRVLDTESMRGGWRPRLPPP